MILTQYTTHLDDNHLNILIKEKSWDCTYESLTSPETIADMLNEVCKLNKKAEEYLYMLALDNKCNPLGLFEISHGTSNYSVARPREILIRALLCGATHIILAHNHPSQDTSPSTEDRQMYKRLTQACDIVGITLLDNIIIGEGYYSFAEEGEESIYV